MGASEAGVVCGAELRGAAPIERVQAPRLLAADAVEPHLRLQLARRRRQLRGQRTDLLAK